MADREKWEQVQDPTSEGYATYQAMITGLVCFTDDLRSFRQRVIRMTERYFEPLKRRSSDAYSKAYSLFYGQMVSLSAWLLGEDFEQTFPMQVSFVFMMQRGDESKIFIAEKATFNRLTDFLRAEFYRRLAKWNAPRRCHNCGRYFLLTEGELKNKLAEL